MKPLDFVHLALMALGGEIKGKTNLQKKVYFLGELTDKLDELGYRAHFYGPYSDDVALAIEDLKTVGFVDQNVVSAYMADEMGFERFRYDYRLTDAGQKAGLSKSSHNAELWKRLQDSATILGEAGDLDYLKLSVAAKTYFLLGQKRGRASKEELARLAPRFGWRVSTDEIEQAALYLDKVGLVRLDKD